MLKSIVLFISAVAFMLSGCMTNSAQPTAVRLRPGSDPKWYAYSYNDNAWDKSNGTTLKGIYTMRFHFDFLRRGKAFSPFVVQVIALGSYDAYWDGRYIGSSGKVADSKILEIPGYHHLMLSLMDSISKPGHHVLALRISNFHYQRKYTFFNVHAGTYEDLTQFPKLMLIVMSMLGGIFLTGTIYYVFLYLAHPSEPLFLVFAFLCFLFLALLATEYLPAIWNYSYPFQFIRLEVIGILTLSISMLIPYFLNRQFSTFRPYIFNSGVTFTLLAIFIFYHGRYDFTARVLGMVMGVACLIIVLKAAMIRAQGYMAVLAALTSAILAATYTADKTTKSYSFQVVANNFKSKIQRTGMGHKYIQARLNESYGKNWLFHSHEIADGWITKITIHR